MILQERGTGEITAVPEVAGSHHVLRVVHLLGQLWDGDGTEGVSSTRGERSEPNHEEMETWERNHVHSQLPQVGVELTRESETGGDTGHDGGHEVVEISIRWGAELESPHTNVVQGLVIDTEGLIRVLNYSFVSVVANECNKDV